MAETTNSAAAAAPSEESQPRRKYARRQLLIDKSFQLKYTAYVVLLSTAIAAVLGWFLYKNAVEASHVSMMQSGFSDEMVAQLKLLDQRMLIQLVGFLVALVVGLTMIGVVVTHRVAGPIFIISRYLREIGGGKLLEPRPLRKRDELKGFFETFNAMLSALRARQNEDIAELDSVGASIRNRLAQLREKGADAALCDELEADAKTLAGMKARKEKSFQRDDV